MKCTSPLWCSTEACPGKLQLCPGMECATEFDFIYHQQPHLVNIPSRQLLLVSYANHPHMCVAGSIYGHDCNENVTSHSFSRVSPRSPAVTHHSLLFHISYFEFHHLYRPLGISAPQGFLCKEPMYGLWCIVSLTRKKYLRFKPWFALNFKQSITGVSSVGEATIQCPVEVSEVSPVVYFFQSSAMIQKVFKTSIKGNIRQKKENWCIIPVFENLPW